MKIEIGESIMLSWLKHVKGCQLVQTNWKASYQWELKYKETLLELMMKSKTLFEDKYGYNLYKGTSSLDQLILQAEIDVLGSKFKADSNHVYAIDVAFHGNGLSYGSRDETVSRVIKKILRTAMCVYGYFHTLESTIIFTTPKITPSIKNDLERCLDDIIAVLKSVGLHYDIEIIANEEFQEKVLEPVIHSTNNVADTSELFMRSLQMYQMFSTTKPNKSVPTSNLYSVPTTSQKVESIDILNEPVTFKNKKIGVLAKTYLKEILESDSISDDEIERMQTRKYSIETFHIRYPLLLKVEKTNGEKPVRYYATPLNIYGQKYFLCSEWYETPANNDRPYLIKWLELNGASRTVNNCQIKN